MLDTVQDEYRFEFESGTYVARLTLPPVAGTASAAFQMVSPSGLTIGTHVLPQNVQDVEIYLLGWFVNWDAKLYRPAAA